MVSFRWCRRLAIRLGVVAAVVLAGSVSAGGAAAAPFAERSGHMLVHRVAPAESGGAAAYWTPARMVAAVDDTLGDKPGGRAAVRPDVDGTYFNGIPVVGALFFTTSGPTGHFCTATVIVSAHQDRLVTAAHCLYGAKNVAFVPEYHNGQAPHGTWSVTKTFFDSRWPGDHNDYDFAFAQTSGKTKLQAAVGADEIGFNQTVVGQQAHLVGYPSGRQQAVQCTTKVTPHGRYLEFDCGNFADGTSGSGWVLGYNDGTKRGTLVGVIGGPDAGGPNDKISYSDPFDNTVKALYDTAEKG